MERDRNTSPVINTQRGYRQAARYDDEIEIRTRGELLSPVRLRFQYEVVRISDGTLLAEGQTAHGSIGADGRPRRLPDRVVDIFEPTGREDGR